jgi:hypothetical protein
MVNASVSSDREQPGLQRRAIAVVRFKITEGGDEYLLSHILRLVLVANQIPRKPEDRPLVTLNQMPVFARFAS